MKLKLGYPYLQTVKIFELSISFLVNHYSTELMSEHKTLFLPLTNNPLGSR